MEHKEQEEQNRRKKGYGEGRTKEKEEGISREEAGRRRRSRVVSGVS